jgi:hypothetical protein
VVTPKQLLRGEVAAVVVVAAAAGDEAAPRPHWDPAWAEDHGESVRKDCRS